MKLTALFMLCSVPLLAANKEDILWEKLANQVQKIAGEVDGVVGVALVDLTSGRTLMLNADEQFATASSIKIAVLAELYRQGKTQEMYTMNAADLVPGSTIMEGLTPGVTKLTLRDVATFMVTVSDNAATNVLIDRLGMDRVNVLLDSLTLNQVRLQRKMMDVEAAKQGRENIGTPRQMTGLLEAIYRNKVVNAEQTKDLLRILSLPKSSQIPKLLPESVSIANKPGSLDGVRNDSGIVMLRSRPFVISVMTGYLRDGRAGESAISRIALAAYRHFEMLGAASPLGRVMSELKN